MRRLKKEEILQIKNLAKGGFSLQEVSKKLGIPKSTAYYHSNKYLKKMSRIDLKKLFDWERGYIIGLFAGDGYFNFIQKNYSYILRFYFNRKKDQKVVQKLGYLIEKCGSKFHTFSSKEANCLEVRICSKKIIEFIKNYISFKKGKGNKSTRKNLIEPKIWSKEFKLGFIGGIIDSDGFTGFDKKKYVRCFISTSSNYMASQILEILNELDLNPSCYINKRKNSKTDFKKNFLYIIRISTPKFISNIDKIKSVKGLDFLGANRSMVRSSVSHVI